MRRAALPLALLALAVLAPAARAWRSDGEWVEPGNAVISPDGRFLYATGSTTLTYARDPGTGSLTRIADNDPGGVSIALAPDGRHAYVGGGSNIHVERRDPVSGVLLHVSTIGDDPSRGWGLDGVRTVAVSPDGHQLYAAVADDDELLVFDLGAGGEALSAAQVVTDGGAGVPGQVAVAPDGRTVYVAGSTGLATLRRAADGRLTPVGAFQGTDTDLAVSPDGRRVFAGTDGNFTAYDRDPATGGLTEAGGGDRPPHGDESLYRWPPGAALAASPDGRTVAATAGGGNRLIDYAAGPGPEAVLADLHDGEGGITGMAGPRTLVWSPDSRFLYVASAPQDVVIHGQVVFGGGQLGQLATFRRGADGRLSFVAGGRVPLWPRENGGSNSITIDGGADYTNDPHVTVTFGCNVGSLWLANAPGLAGGTLLHARDDDTYAWSLGGSGPARDVRRVYARCTSLGAPTAVYHDDIILDTRAPSVRTATLAVPRSARSAPAGAMLALRARDNRSGVRFLQLAKTRAHPGRRRRYRSHVRLGWRPRHLFVRVTDRAGNRSAWRRVVRRRRH